MSFDFLSAIRNVAPWIAGTFGTPLAGLAVKAICDALPADSARGIQDAHAADPVSGAISAVSDLLSKGKIAITDIQKAELAHTELMTQLGYKTVTDLEKIAADDRDSARRRQGAVKDSTPAVLAYLLIAGTGLAIAGTLLGYTKVDSALAGTLIGYLVAECRTALSYFFGTTSASQGKDATIAEIAKS